MSELPMSDAPAGGSQANGRSAGGSQSGEGPSGGSQSASRRRRRSRGGSAGGGRTGSSVGEGRDERAADAAKQAPAGRAKTPSGGEKGRQAGAKAPGGGPKAPRAGAPKTSKTATKGSSGEKGAGGGGGRKGPSGGTGAQGAGRAADEGRPNQRRSDRTREAPAGMAERGGGPPPGTRAHEAADRENAARLAANRRRVRELAGLTAASPALVGGVVVGVVAGAPLGAAVAVVLVVGAALLVWRGALGRALRVTGGRRAAPEELPGLANQVDGLCATIGVARPELWILDEPVPNACSLDGPGSPGVLLVTTGLVEGLDRIELEGVLAHELVHLKRCDAVVSAVAVATVGALCATTGRDGLLHRSLGMGREYEADQAAALAVRYPPGLERALGAMGGDGAGAAARAPARGAARSGVFLGRRWAATRWIWIDPMAGDASETVEGDLDATSVRRDALAQW